VARKKNKWESFGHRLKSIREERGMSIEDLSEDTGYSVDILEKVESGDTPPPVALILQLSKTLKVDMEQVDSEEDKDASKGRVASHKKRVESYAYTPLTRPGKDKHLRAYLVTIDPRTEHKGVEYHHEGEEFIYVLSGGLKIQVGQNTKNLGPGESIHFNSALHHRLSNPADETAELLVVIYVP